MDASELTPLSRRPTAMSGTVVFGGTRIPLTALFDCLDMERAFAGFSAAPHRFPVTGAGGTALDRTGSQPASGRRS